MQNLNSNFGGIWLPSSRSSNGLWLPHSSSVDFCEPDYFLTDSIAEFHNSWSSLLISTFALIGFFYGNPTKEWRFSFMYLSLFVIGLGSVCLHSTLHWLPQSSDEVPMLWQNFAYLYALIEMNSPKNQPKFPFLPILMFLVAIIQTIIYYSFRQYYISFLISFITAISIFIIWSGYYAYFDKTATVIELSQRQIIYGISSSSFLLIAVPLWIFEMNFCNFLLPYYKSAFGLSFHIIWHFCAGFSGYLTGIYLSLIRIQALKTNASIIWIFGIFPIWKSIPFSKQS